MIRVMFKELVKSELARDLAIERIETVVGRFPDLKQHRLVVTLGTENSPTQAGLDAFTVKLFIDGSRYKSLSIQKSAPSLYAALADVVEHSLELLNRYGDRGRVMRRSRARQALVSL